jgi:outer membrane lipoprotein-sorting protein
MASLPEVRPARPERPFELPRPAILALSETSPTFDELWAFMRDAERRFRTLRMRVVERTQSAAGTSQTRIEVWLAHPGRAKVIENRDATDERPASYFVWVSDGERVRTYDSATNVTTERAHRHVPDEISAPELPAFARIVPPITELPMESLPEAFIHPAGLTRNLSTGRVALVGQRLVAGREALVLEIGHPRATVIETDRPDRVVTLAVDRESGVIMLLEERIGDAVTRHAEVTHLEPDAPIRDDVFTIHVPSDAVTIF